MFNPHLFDRALQVYRRDGILVTFTKILRYSSRSSLHWLGRKGLYANDLFLRFIHWRNVQSSAAQADPFKRLHVDPSSINYITNRGPNPGRFQWIDLGLVQSGEWDNPKTSFSTLPVYKALDARFNNGEDWENIDFVQHVLSEVERGRVIWRGCQSREDVFAACERIDDLFAKIKEEGYRSMEDLVSAGEASPDKFVTGDGLRCYDEVAVDIGREGEFLFVDGRHRLTIAKILGVDTIPVRISARHTRWQQMRETVNQSSISEVPAEVSRHLGHPDLRDVN